MRRPTGIPPPDVDHVAERAKAIEARRQSQAALEEALRTREETKQIAETLRAVRAANRFAERIAESFRE